MTQAEKREYLITELLKESPEYENLKIPTDETEQKKLLRSLFNIRMPLPVSDDFITIRLRNCLSFTFSSNIGIL